MTETAENTKSERLPDIHMELSYPSGDYHSELFNVVEGVEYPDDPLETVEMLKKELDNLKEIVHLLKRIR